MGVTLSKPALKFDFSRPARALRRIFRLTRVGAPVLTAESAASDAVEARALPNLPVIGPQPGVSLELGQYKVLPRFDLDYYLGKKSVFLVSRGLSANKRGVFYLVKGFNADTAELLLYSGYGADFNSRMEITTPDRYVMVVGPLGTQALPAPIVEQVQAKCLAVANI